MKGGLVVCAILGGVAIYWYMKSDKDVVEKSPTQAVVVDKEAEPTTGQLVEPSKKALQRYTETVPDEPVVAENLLVVGGEEFEGRLHESIRRKFMLSVSHCREVGDRKDKLNLTFQLDISQGEVTTSQILSEGSAVGEFTNCVLEAVRTARFWEPTMPPWNGEYKLTVAYRTLKKYEGWWEQEDMLEK